MNPEYYEYYKTFTIDEFIMDEEFRDMILHPDHRLTELLSHLPEKEDEIRAAAQIVRGLQAPKLKQTAQRKQELWQEIVNTHQRRVRMTYFRYAAILIIMLTVGAAVFFVPRMNFNRQALAKASATNSTMLILANGESVSIDSKQSTVKYSADGTGVLVNDTSGVAQSVQGEGMNRMIVPHGKRSTITLSDGTKVWLNSGSTLSFPAVFRRNFREVILTGEAFFEVTHNKEKPFYVKTENFRTKVYGTKFDIKAYADDKHSEIVLVEGKVSMSSSADNKEKEVFLTPYHKASIAKGESDFQISQVENMDAYTSWIDGYLTFTNVELSDLLKQVSRYYNVEIRLTNEENIDRIYGKLDLKDELDRVLSGIAFISKTSYRKVGNRYEFYTPK